MRIDPSDRPFFTIDNDASLPEALELMRDEGVEQLVVTKDKDIVGIIAAHDLLTKGLSSNSIILNPIVRVGDVMRPVDQTIDETTDIRDAIASMRRQGLTALPMLHEGSLVGVLTPSDLVSLLDHLLKDERIVDMDDGSDDMNVGDRSKLWLGKPFLQNIMRTLADIGI